jgi:hypothetical protein
MTFGLPSTKLGITMRGSRQPVRKQALSRARVACEADFMVRVLTRAGVMRLTGRRSAFLTTDVKTSCAWLRV